MKTKKILAGACASLLMAVTAIPAVTAADGFTAEIGNTTAAAGETFSVTLDFANIPTTGLNACDFGVQYDSNVLTISDVTLGDIAKGDETTTEGMPSPFEFNIEDDLISVMYGIGTTNTSYNMTGSGTFLTISGTVSDTAAAGTKSELSIVAVDRNTTPAGTTVNDEIIFGNLGVDESAPTIYEVNFVNGYVEVIDSETTNPTEETTETPTEIPTEAPSINFGTPSKMGDVNLDGSVGVADITALNKYLLSVSTYPLQNDIANANADCVPDKVLDMRDSSAIVNVVLGVLKESDLGVE